MKKHVSYLVMSEGNLLFRQIMFGIGLCMSAVPAYVLFNVRAFEGGLIPYSWNPSFYGAVIMLGVLVIAGFGLMIYSNILEKVYLQDARKKVPIRKKRDGPKIDKNYKGYSIGSLDVGDN